MAKPKGRPSDFDIAYFVEHYIRSDHADKVERGPTRHLTHSLATWVGDPSRFDFAGVDTQVRREPPKNFKKEIPKIKHYLHANLDVFHNVYWSQHKHPSEDRW
jgi:hypothetical protein